MRQTDATLHRFDNAAKATGPMAGVRVIDLTSNVLGPLATQTLGDMGADVIKVEAPDGDAMRDNGPGRNPGMSAFFLNMNRNKRSLAIDLKGPAAREDGAEGQPLNEQQVGRVVADASELLDG